MRTIRVGGHRVICPICRRRYARMHALGTVTCGQCLKALFVGYMTGNNIAWAEIHRKYDIKRKEVKE